jgi:predicted DNA-binding transcriptional regulator AlpA
MQSETPTPKVGGRTTTTNTGVASLAPGSAGVQPELLTSKQSAELANVGERTWWRWTRCGLAPAPVKIGIGPRAAVRYRRADIMAWIDGGCRPVDGRGA